MKRKSIRTRLHIVIGFIVLLPAITVTGYVLNERMAASDTRYHDILNLETCFYDTILWENASLQLSSRATELTSKYDKLDRLSSVTHDAAALSLFNSRRTIVNQLLGMQQQSVLLYASVDRVLPELIKSVRYIHQHHIAYMKNLLDRGAYAKGYDSGKAFKRSQIKSAPEMDIIAAAVSIQTSLLDVLKTFYDLQKGSLPSAVRAEFENRVHRFYAATNAFEDFSLDAQDGLLVEELLKNGRSFEDWFKKLLTIEQKKGGLHKALNENRASILEKLKQLRDAIEKFNRKSAEDIELLQICLLLLGLILAAYVFFQNRRIAGEFRRTVNETEKMQRDITYRIQTGTQDFDEFQIIYTALNSMAQTIDLQIQELEEAQSYLNQRVAERTAELVNANTLLHQQIEERIHSEQMRVQLETRLSRVQKMEAIGALAGGVAHDLNNILSGIVSYPELVLLEMPEDHPLREIFLNIMASGERAAAIVQDLLTLSRRGIMVSEIVNLNVIVNNYLTSPEFLKMASYHPDIHVELSLQPDLGNILGSPVHLAKTIMNLVTNAAEAMPNGGKIVIATQNGYVDAPIGDYEDVQEGDYVRLSITDEGTGIPKEDMERIFEPFFSRKKMGRSGTGLGMAVVWGTVKDHHGYIDIQSIEGEGAMFTLYFPLTRQQPAQEESPVSIESYTGNGETVLVVDDIEEQRHIAMQFLRKLGYSVDAVASGEAAIEYLKTTSMSLLVMDMIMPPGMDGLETYQKILAQHPGQKAVIASGFSASEKVHEAQRLGAGCYIKKPYTLKKLGMAVKNEIHRHRAE